MELADGVPDDGIAAARLAERHGSSAVSGLVRRGWLDLVVATRERRPLAGRAPGERGSRPAGAPLTDDQARVVGPGRRRHRAIAGPTRCCWRASSRAARPPSTRRPSHAALDAGRDALVLVPEASLALPLVDRLRHDLGIEPVLVHGGLSAGERADEWRRLRAATAPQVVVGTRLAILAPVRDPGVIVVDEEHDPAYKSDRTPRYQARDLALELGRLAGAPVDPGQCHARHRERRSCAAGAPRPMLRLVDRAAGTSAIGGRRGPARGAGGGQPGSPVGARWWRPWRRSIPLPASRRSWSSTGAARHRWSCAGTAATSRSAPSASDRWCSTRPRWRSGVTTVAPPRRPHVAVPSCASPRIRYLGGGTQRVEQEVSSPVPGAAGQPPRSGRGGAPGSRRRGHRRPRGRADGRAGGHQPRDQGSRRATGDARGGGVRGRGPDLPDERAAERTWQLLAQAVGRAGRGDQPGRAIIQTYLPDHPAIRAVADGDARAFVDGGAGPAATVRFAALRPAGEADRRAAGARPRARRRRGAWPTELRARAAGVRRSTTSDRAGAGARVRRAASRPLAVPRRAPRLATR